MDALRTGVFVLFVLLVPVSSKEIYFTDPMICYFLDMFLVVYCIIATALFFREKFQKVPSAAKIPEDNGGIYQELERPKDADPYQVLEPSKGKKKKKKKSGSSQAEEKDKDPYESLMLNGPAPAPLPPQ